MSEEHPLVPDAFTEAHEGMGRPVGDSPVAAPQVVPVEMLTFSDAVAAIIDGHHVGDRVTITRVEWDDPDTYIYMGEAKLRIHTGRPRSPGAWTDHDLLVSVGDLLGTDWVVR